MTGSAHERVVLTFYRFFELNDPAGLRDELAPLGERLDLKGTILLAAEGINGTVVGRPEALATLAHLLQQRCGELPFKRSSLDEDNAGFYRFKVRVKPEIVSFGVEGVDARDTGEHVGVAQWHELQDDPDVVVIDTRNTYEIAIGTFPGAVSPETTNFREFPAWVTKHLDPARQPRVAMFCTGGIRCEKASAYLKKEGFDQVYQLDGGILRYLEHAEPDENRWQGECFVFDQRVSVNAELGQGAYQQCFACRHPLSEADAASPDYEQGVSCPHCIDASDATRTDNLRERQRQVALAEARGAQHIGKPQ